MTRRLTTTVLLAGSLLALPLLAQPKGRAGGGPFAPHHGHGGDRVADFLELTAEQREQWDALHQELRGTIRPSFEQQRTLDQELRGLLDEASPDPAAVGTIVLQQRDNRRSIEAAHEQLKEQLAAILTAEQLDRLDAFHAARGSGRRHHGPGPGFRGRR
jgi:Spy/CpxP family protein refolding chaperone